MSFRAFAVIVAFFDTLAWAGFTLVLFLIDPFTSRAGVVLMLAALFVSLWGLFALIGMFARRPLREHDAVVHRLVRRAFRQGALLATLAVAAFALNARGVLYWWVVAALVCAIAVWEFFFLSGESVPHAPTS